MSAREPQFRVLFVCSGNTCRSPLAALALQAQLGEAASWVSVDSAGTAAAAGEPASEGSRRIAERDGFDLSAHRSRPLTGAMLREADLVLVMTPAHLAAARQLGADPDRLHVISDWPAPGDTGQPVFDPFGASFEAYEECWRRLRLHARRIAPVVLRALRERRSS
jgi:protein-tyrosine-phosphatase